MKRRASKSKTTPPPKRQNKAQNKAQNRALITSPNSATAEAAYRSIAEILRTARATAYRAVNQAMVEAYWQIGRVIVEHEQQGKKRAGYGETLIEELARRLTEEFGKGFTATNLKYRRQFYLTFPIRHALRDELSWTHYRLLLRVENELARGFYLQRSGQQPLEYARVGAAD